jgi:hypothetical protein
MDPNHSRSVGGPLNWRRGVGATGLVDWNILRRDANSCMNRKLALRQGRVNVQYVLFKLVWLSKGKADTRQLWLSIKSYQIFCNLWFSHDLRKTL